MTDEPPRNTRGEHANAITEFLKAGESFGRWLAVESQTLKAGPTAEVVGRSGMESFPEHLVALARLYGNGEIGESEFAERTERLREISERRRDERDKLESLADAVARLCHSAGEDPSPVFEAVYATRTTTADFWKHWRPAAVLLRRVAIAPRGTGRLTGGEQESPPDDTAIEHLLTGLSPQERRLFEGLQESRHWITFESLAEIPGAWRNPHGEVTDAAIIKKIRRMNEKLADRHVLIETSDRRAKLVRLG